MLFHDRRNGQVSETQNLIENEPRLRSVPVSAPWDPRPKKQFYSIENRFGRMNKRREQVTPADIRGNNKIEKATKRNNQAAVAKGQKPERTYYTKAERAKANAFLASRGLKPSGK